MKVNISIDDISPHPLSSTRVLDRCNEMIKERPDIKFSIFVPVAYWRTKRPETITKSPLDIRMFPAFCDQLRHLPKENYEVCMHGLFHGIPGVSDNDEFQYLSYEEALEKFKIIRAIIHESGLENIFKNVFRPPAWRMSAESIAAAKDAGIEVLALSPKDYAMQTYAGADKTFKNVVYYTCNPPFDQLQKFDKNEIVYHACEWDKNYLDEHKSNDLLEWLKTQEDVEFVFIEGLL